MAMRAHRPRLSYDRIAAARGWTYSRVATTVGGFHFGIESQAGIADALGLPLDVAFPLEKKCPDQRQAS